jgi:hypothetical protein
VKTAADRLAPLAKVPAEQMESPATAGEAGATAWPVARPATAGAARKQPEDQA